MRKILLLLFICISGYALHAQQVLIDVVDNYYPTNPFTGKLSDFLQDLMYTGFLTEKEIHKRTDTSLFYLKGDYIVLTPFSFQPTRAEIVLAEQEISFSNSSKTSDTIFVYQLVGRTDAGLEEVRQEFTKFERKFGKKFSHSTYDEITDANGKAVGHTHNYFLKISPVSPLSVTWGKMGGSEYAFIITVRFLSRQNEILIPYFVIEK